MSQIILISRTNDFLNIRTIILTILFSLMTVLLTAQEGLIAEYYDGRNFNRKVVTQIEKQINHYWNRIPPVPGINPHVCSIRWTGKLTPDKTGYYTFSARVDDGIRVWIDDQLVIEDWNLNDVGVFQGSKQLQGGTSYNLKVEYFNALIEGEIRLLWKFEKKKPNWFQRIVHSEPATIIEAAHFSHTSEQARKIIIQEPGMNVKTTGDNSSKSASVAVNNAQQKPNPKKLYTHPVEVGETESSLNHEVEDPEEMLTPETINKYIPGKIHFERTKYQLLESSFNELDRLAGFLIRHPELYIRIEGHTDSAGDPEKNLILSQRRAYAVARYLIKQGISGKRIKAKGFGSDHPLIVSKGKEYHPENRRVEFIIE